MQRMTKHLQNSLLIVAFALGVCVTCSAQTGSNTTAPLSLANRAAQDNETLKALEIANIRLAAANETIRLLNDRLAAKDAVIEAKNGLIEIRDEQLALAKSANQDRAAVNVGDLGLLNECKNQLAKADAEIYNLRNPGLLRELFAPKEVLKIGGAFFLGRATAPK